MTRMLPDMEDDEDDVGGRAVILMPQVSWRRSGRGRGRAATATRLVRGGYGGVANSVVFSPDGCWVVTSVPSNDTINMRRRSDDAV